MSFFRTLARRSTFRATPRAGGGHSGGPPFHGFTPPYVAPVHKNMGEIMMAVMWYVFIILIMTSTFFFFKFICWILSQLTWIAHVFLHTWLWSLIICVRFWIFYRAKEDGMAVLVSNCRFGKKKLFVNTIFIFTRQQ